jgi:hypothetical protein
MATRDGFPLVRSGHGEEPGQPGTGTASRRAVISPRILKASILGATAAAIVFAAVLVENPRVLFANATAFLVALSAPQDGTREEMPIVQSSAGTQASAMAQALPPTASAAPTDNEMAASLKTADQSQPETGQAPTEDLLGQFQAWAAGQDARAEVQPAQPAPVQPVQEAKADPVANPAADPVQEARAEIRPVQSQRPVQSHRPVRRVKNARSEIPAKPIHRAKVRREQNARVQVQPEQNARVQVRPEAQVRPQQDQPVQNARAPSFLESIGLHD